MEAWTNYKITDEVVKACRNEAGFQLTQDSKKYWIDRANFLEDLKGKQHTQVESIDETRARKIVFDINKLDY